MKLNETNKNSGSGKRLDALGAACVNSCKKVLAQIGRTKDSILSEARERLEAPEKMLRLALNEAEALAWETLYPHLFFADLAEEKVREVAVWNRRQQAVGGQARLLARPVLN